MSLTKEERALIDNLYYPEKENSSCDDLPAKCASDSYEAIADTIDDPNNGIMDMIKRSEDPDMLYKQQVLISLETMQHLQAKQVTLLEHIYLKLNKDK